MKSFDSVKAGRKRPGFPDWLLTPAWVLAGGCANAVWVLAEEYYRRSEVMEWRGIYVTAGFIAGFAAAGLQWLILQQQFPDIAQWIPATIGAWGLGAATATLAIGGNGYLSAMTAGVVAGVCQWFVLAKYYRRAGWWIVAVAIGWLVVAVADANSAWAASLIDLPARNVVLGAINGAAGSLASAFLLVRILANRRPVD